MDFLSTLRQTRLFDGLPDQELNKVISLMKPIKCLKGEEICREGSSDDRLFVVALGSVRATRRVEGAEEAPVATIGTHSYFGELALASPEHKRSATITALEDSELLVLSGADLDAAAESDVRLGYFFYKALSRGIAARLRAAANDVAILKSLARPH
jgi:CRP-like cAMP-binding protein